MRKTLLVITVLFVAAQAYAGTVTMSVVDEGGGWAAIRYSADANVSGFGLKVTADSGAIFTDINDYNVGECTATVQGYGIFPGTIDINEDTGLVDNNGTPIAPNSAPGANDTGLDTNTLILEMGALYVEPNWPAQNGTLILVEVNEDCNVCVEGEPFRGNVVLTDGNEATLVTDCEFVSGPVTDCYTGPDYNEWKNVVGEPNSWCNPRQCHGDADGLQEAIGKGMYWVGYNDLSIFIANWKDQLGLASALPADFDHASEAIGKGTYRVGYNDLSVFIANWKDQLGTPADCLTGSPASP